VTGPDSTVPGRGSWLPEGFEAIGPPLGVGATAVVWPARRVLDGRELALKVWRRPFADDSERARFRREIRRQAALNEVSGHIVTYTWAEENPGHGTPWIGTLRHGSSLQQLLERGGPPFPRRLVLCADLLAGLAAMHGQGLVHRDVKPANVLADGSRAQLCDLGLVLDRAGWTQDGAAGTPRYLAPELLRGDQPSPRSDVYSAARTITETLGPGLPAPLQRLLTSAASADPADRPADAGAFAVRFRQACAELGQLLPAPLPGRSESSSTRPDGGGHGVPVARPRRTRRALIAAAVAAGVAAAAVAAAVLVPGSGDRPGGGPGPAAFATPSAAPPTISSTRAGPTTRPAPSSPAGTGPAAPATGRPDARAAAPDIGPDGDPVVLPATRSGRCDKVLAGARTGEERSYRVDGTVVAVLQTFSSSTEQRSCARLVKPAGSPDADVRTHLALTLCGDGNSCDSDWHGYTNYAGPVIVRSRTGCVSWRISVRDRTGTRWLVRDAVGSAGCP
jgi:serine/threonine-protein kinase